MRGRIGVSQSGPATASAGGVAISGANLGDINVYAQAPSRSLYRQEVVAQIAPKSLHEREPELEEINRFCTAADGEAYVWWQASAWSGKTALLSWFVLNPPPDVRVVSYFITARFKGHADRSAFLEFVLSQLSEILGEPMPMVTVASAEIEFRDRLSRAARFCLDRGERLVLVVDGLDEDCGVVADADVYSIAALLPEEVPDGVRVIVAGRPSPPIPDDVPAAHPLRRPSAVRTLTASPHAAVIRKQMQNEIRRLMREPSGRELLGLVTAAGGGLSGHDLAELTGMPGFEVEEQLHTVAGRSFAKRSAHWRPDSHPEVYLLGHEEIQVEAVNRLGEPTLREHRERLHKWAEGYRARGWPAETPEYLLRGYGRLLHETGDLPRMLAVGTDRMRHDLLFSVSGGDFAALTEIAVVQDMLQAQAPDDLVSLGRVTVHRLRVTKRAASIRVNLPHVWARLGQHDRAETLARSMPDPDRRAWALAGVARAVATNGQTDEALRITDSVTQPRWHTYALTGVARALAVTGNRDRARDLALKAEGTAEGPEEQAGLMQVYTLCGDNDRAWAVFHASQQEGHYAWAGPVAAAGDVVRAQDIAASITEPRWRTYALIGIAQAVAAAGDLSRAQEFTARARDEAASIRESDQHGYALAPLVTVLFDIGQREQAAGLTDVIEKLIASAKPSYHPAYAWAELAKAVAATDDLRRAGEYAARAEKATLASIDMDHELAALVQPLLATGEPELALRIAQRVSEANLRTWALTAAVDVSSDTVVAQAKEAALSIAEPRLRLNALSAVADGALRVGDATTARVLMDESVESAEAQSDHFSRVSGLAPAIELSARLGEPDRARELANRAEENASSIAEPGLRAWALAQAVRALGLCGETDLAWEMAQRLERFAMEADDGFNTDFARGHLVEALAPADKGHAAEVARRIADPITIILGRNVLPVVLTGDFDRAAETARAMDYGGARVFQAQLADVAAVQGDSQRALRLVRETAEALATDDELWHDVARVILVETLVRLGERTWATDLATTIGRLHNRVWAMAASSQDPAQRRAAVASALRVTGWLPIWLPILSPLDPRPSELQDDLPMVPAHILAAAAPEALKAIAEEVLLITES